MDFRVGGRSGGHVLKEDSVHVSGDRGIPALAVRLDTSAALAADGDYLPLSTDDRGRLRVASILVFKYIQGFYSGNFTAPDAASEAALGSGELHSCLIRNTHATFEAEIRTSGGDWVELPANTTVEYLDLDLATVFCKAQTDGENPVLDISGSVFG